MSRILAAHAPQVSSLQRLVDDSDIDEVVFLKDGNLPEGCDGLFIYAPYGSEFTANVSDAVRAALSARLPILASASGMHLLNVALEGDAPKPAPKPSLTTGATSQRTPSFLAPGAKVSSMIGGSGWVSVEFDHDEAIFQSGLAPGLMPSAITAERVVVAFEAPGHSWVIGVQWDVFSANRLPRGFDAVWLAFLERVTGI